MLSKKLFNFIDTEIKMRYGDRTKAAREIGMSKEMIHSILNRLETNGGITTKTLEKICDGIDCEVVIRKKKTKKKASWYYFAFVLLSYSIIILIIFISSSVNLSFTVTTSLCVIIYIHRYNIMQIRINVNKNIQKCRSC